MKRIIKDPYGYEIGESTEITYERLRKTITSCYIRRLDSIDAPINPNEYKVALRCGEYDYHFIRCVVPSIKILGLNITKAVWFTKSGKTKGVMVKDAFVNADYWNPYFYDDSGVLYYCPDFKYNDEIIYFAINKEWK